MSRNSPRSSHNTVSGAQRLQIPPKLGKSLQNFVIERNGKEYNVNLQERRNIDERPYQINVSAVDDDKNRAYMVYKKKGEKSL